MKIPDQVTKTVAFIAYKDQRTGESHPVGSAFFLGPDPIDGSNSSPRVFVVTARHVIEGLKAKGCQHCILRLNPADRNRESIDREISIADWRFHPQDSAVDVAAIECGIPAGVDQLVIPFSIGATNERLRTAEIDLGDEVFVSGLFVHHHGRKRNIPIVRIGHLAALNDEKVSVGEAQIDAFLIEARSIGGLSGSPVFLNLGDFRMIDGQPKMRTGQQPIFYLLGLIHGHFGINQSDRSVDAAGLWDGAEYFINAGIAIVVPFENILETISLAFGTAS